MPSQGDLVLRAAGHVDSRDTQFKLRGMYVVDSGRLHAVARPTTALEAAVGASEAEEHTSDYRHVSGVPGVGLVRRRVWGYALGLRG